MSLQICPCCGKENSFWKIYKDINFKHRFNGCISNCDHCNKSMKIERKQKEMNFIKRAFVGFLWMIPAIVIIYLVWDYQIDYRVGIALVTLFHFGAMYYLIKKSHYEK